MTADDSMQRCGSADAVNGTAGDAATARPRQVLFVDLDNTLYPRSYRIHEMMGQKIHEYFVAQLGISPADAEYLHQTYYRDYGLALEGLVRHHQVDPLEYNVLVDDALPLEQLLKPNPQLRTLLLAFDRTRVRLWILTNAYITHATRVLRLLNLEDIFEGVTYCDYAQVQIICKPKHEMFVKAMSEAGVTSKADCSFVDDSYENVIAAKKFGWDVCIHLCDPSEDDYHKPSNGIHKISSLDELRLIIPQYFKS